IVVPAFLSEDEIGEGVSTALRPYRRAKAVNPFTAELVLPRPVDVANYAKEYEEYLRLLHAHEGKLARVVRLPLEIANRGTAHAHDLEVALNIPLSNVDIVRPGQLPGPPSEPDPPRPALRALFDPPITTHDPSYWMPRIPSMAEQMAVTVVGPEIMEADAGWIVSYHVRSLPAKLTRDLGVVCVWFDSFED